MANLDDEIKKALNKKIEVTSLDKKEIWGNIEKELYLETKGERRKMKTNKRRYSAGVATAAAILLLIGSQTQTGYSIINQIKTFFVSEKEVPQPIEGQDEDTKVSLHEGSKSEYAIYIDEERYQFIQKKESDRIVPKIPLEDRYPEVSMEIQQVENKSPEELINELYSSNKDSYESAKEPEQVTDPVSGWVIHFVQGQQWDSAVKRIYVISNQKQGSFIITQNYFLEAAEGHGARFYQMLKEFYIVDKEQGEN